VNGGRIRQAGGQNAMGEETEQQQKQQPDRSEDSRRERRGYLAAVFFFSFLFSTLQVGFGFEF